MRWVALLRGVNVGGNRKLPMADLRRFAEDLGFTEVTTLLASGNLVFTVPDSDPAALETRLEQAAEAQLGLRTDIFVRSAADVRGVVAANPFPDQAPDRPGHLLVHFHRDPVPSAWVDAVSAENSGAERLVARGRELFVDYRDGIGTSALPPLMIKARHRRLNTARNWNTVTALLALLEG
jgi:uncharacterized protein (DUF1697 family)